MRSRAKQRLRDEAPRQLPATCWSKIGTTLRKRVYSRLIIFATTSDRGGSILTRGQVNAVFFFFFFFFFKPDWPTFLEDFQRHWPTDENIYVDFVRVGAVRGMEPRAGATPDGDAITEERAGRAKIGVSFRRAGFGRNPPIRGFVAALHPSAAGQSSAFGRSMAGTFPRDVPSLPRSMPRSGAAASPARIGRATSTTLQHLRLALSCRPDGAACHVPQARPVAV